MDQILSSPPEFKKGKIWRQGIDRERDGKIVRLANVFKPVKEELDGAKNTMDLQRFDVFHEIRGKSELFIRIYKSAPYNRYPTGFTLADDWKNVFGVNGKNTECPMYQFFCYYLASKAHFYFNDKERNERCLWEEWTCRMCPQAPGISIKGFNANFAYKSDELLWPIAQGLEVIPVYQAVELEYKGAGCGLKNWRYQIVFDGDTAELPAGTKKEDAIMQAGKKMQESQILTDLYKINDDGTLSPVESYPFDFYHKTSKNRKPKGKAGRPYDYYEYRRGNHVEFLGLLTSAGSVEKFREVDKGGGELCKVRFNEVVIIDISDLETEPASVYAPSADVTPKAPVRKLGKFAVRHGRSGGEVQELQGAETEKQAIKRAEIIRRSVKYGITLIIRDKDGKVVQTKPVKLRNN